MGSKSECFLTFLSQVSRMSLFSSFSSLFSLSLISSLILPLMSSPMSSSLCFEVERQILIPSMKSHLTESLFFFITRQEEKGGKKNELTSFLILSCLVLNGNKNKNNKTNYLKKSRSLKICKDHFFNKIIKRNCMRPTKFCLGLGRISNQQVNFSGSKIFWIYGNKNS